MTLPQFTYHRPATLPEALALLRGNPDARPLAGGQTLLPAMKQRLSRPSALVDLQGIAEFQGVSVSPSAIRIGAMTRQADILVEVEATAYLPLPKP